MANMVLLGRLHPLLVHFPIGLVILAALAETVATMFGDRRWRTVAVANVRVGAVSGLLAAIAGWRLALAPGIESSALLESHRWLGAIAAAAMVTAALASSGRSRLGFGLYRISLFSAAALVAVAGHFGGLLVWGTDFLRP